VTQRDAVLLGVELQNLAVISWPAHFSFRVAARDNAMSVMQ
jgi:hypothetical protein